MCFIYAVAFRYFYRACQGSLFPSHVHQARQLDQLPSGMRRHLLNQNTTKPFHMGSLTFKNCSSTVMHLASAEPKDKPTPSSGLRMNPESSPGSLKNTKHQLGRDPTQNTEDSDSKERLTESNTLPYTKDSSPSHPKFNVLTSTPMLPHTESVQLISPTSGGPLGVTYKKNRDGSDIVFQVGGGNLSKSLPDHLQEHSWCFIISYACLSGPDLHVSFREMLLSGE